MIYFPKICNFGIAIVLLVFMLKALLGLVFTFCLALPTWAQAISATYRCVGVYQPSVFEIFKAGYGPLYSDGNCSDNIYYFLKRIRELAPNTDLTTSKVLYLYARSPDFHVGYTEQRFRALQSRDGNQPSKWTFHVVLLHEGHIYDFDKGNKPTAVPVHQYFYEMFGAVAKDKKTLFRQVGDRLLHEFWKTFFAVKTISAATYLRSHLPHQAREGFEIDGYNKAINWLKSRSLPDQRVEDFLSEQAPD